LLTPLLFYGLVVTLFAIGAGGGGQRLGLMAPAIIWVGALLSALLGLERVFRSDHEDGSLELLSLSGHPLAVLALAKVMTHWLVSGLPLTLLSPLLASSLGMPTEGMLTLFVSLLLGTLCLSMVGAIGVALTLGLPRGGLLLALLVLPLYVPVMIFGVSATEAALTQLDPSGILYLMAALVCMALVLAPLAVALAIKASLS
jgi:heme exporter protein B